MKTLKDIPVIWVLGGPGSGKGTQCAKLAKKYGFEHLSTGDLLRAEVASGSHKGRQLNEIMSKGGLVPSEEVLCLLEGVILRKCGAAKGFLIDGYPREKCQGIAFERKITPVDLILYFDCSDETLVMRVLGRAATTTHIRADDNLQVVRTRVGTFRKANDEILAQYPTKLVYINGERNVDEIFADAARAVDCCLLKKRKRCCQVYI